MELVYQPCGANNYNYLSHTLFHQLNILTQYSKIHIYHYLIVIIVIGLVSKIFFFHFASHLHMCLICI